MFGLVCGA